MLLVALAALAAAALSPPAAPSTAQTQPTPLEAVTAAHTTLLAHVALFQAELGEYETSDLAVRLEGDMSDLNDPQAPDFVSQQDWNDRLNAVAALDTDIVHQIVSGDFPSLASATGLQERIMKSDVDGRLQLVAVYVPQSVGPRTSLVVLLHGRPQTESDLIGWPYFRALADKSGSIVVVPYGRGAYDYEGPATADVYQLADAAVAAFHIDPRRVYLAGYSMGGFSVFKVGPVHADRWAGVLCVAGAILNSETSAVRAGFARTPFYVVTGANDVNIPAKYGEMTAAYLAGVGFRVEFDEEAHGTHYLPSIMPSLETAWTDMLSGTVKHPPSATLDAMPDFGMPSIDDSARP